MAYTTIDDSSAHFQNQLYTGTGSNGNAITNGGNSDLQPDFVWVKSRGNANHDHHVWDSSRGVGGKDLYPNEVFAEGSDANRFTAFNTDGFSIGGAGHVNTDGDAYVSWQWKANGGTTSSLSSATVESNTTTACVRQVNTTAGFSIMTYTADSNGEQFLEHGLGKSPQFILVKNRGETDNWAVGHGRLTGTTPWYSYCFLNTNAAVASHSSYWLNTSPTDNIINLGGANSVGVNGENYVCYAWTEVPGFSKFGRYIGNGNSNGPYVPCGFKPSWLLHKRIDGTENWGITNIDSSARAAGTQGNDMANQLEADDSTAEANQVDFWFTSNGFKLDGSGAFSNAVDENYIFAAFADNPFVTSKGVPCTAR